MQKIKGMTYKGKAMAITCFPLFQHFSMRRVMGQMLGLSCCMALLGACSPTVKLEAPDEPIRFDVNINITEQKKLEIDRELLDLIRQNPALFGLNPDDISALDDEGSKR